MMVGVNGTGKTTTSGKLAALFTAQHRTVLLCAADTFRAAAIEQLEVWATRSGVPIIKTKQGGDPSAALYDACTAAKARGTQVLIVDTAGRLHTKTDLMKELDKMRRTAEKLIPGAPHQTLLVMDATTGQNGLTQARLFTEAARVTGIVLTKLDGTAKGGIVLAIATELGLPVVYAGTGEKIEDLIPFDSKILHRFPHRLAPTPHLTAREPPAQSRLHRGAEPLEGAETPLEREGNTSPTNPSRTTKPSWRALSPSPIRPSASPPRTPRSAASSSAMASLSARAPTSTTHRDHAEIVALKAAAAAGHHPAGATAYVTLEPCSHHGRTGPCADALIAARISRCCRRHRRSQSRRQRPRHRKLRAAGIEVTLGLLEAERAHPQRRLRPLHHPSAPLRHPQSRPLRRRPPRPTPRRTAPPPLSPIGSPALSPAPRSSASATHPTPSSPASAPSSPTTHSSPTAPASRAAALFSASSWIRTCGYPSPPAS